MLSRNFLIRDRPFVLFFVGGGDCRFFPNRFNSNFLKQSESTYFCNHEQSFYNCYQFNFSFINIPDQHSSKF